MNTHTSAPSGPLAADNTRWTGEKASTFLKLLARSGKVAPCARAVGMSRQAAYRLRARAPTFARFWAIAMAQAAAVRASSARGHGRRKAVHPLLDPHPAPPGPRDGQEG